MGENLNFMLKFCPSQQNNQDIIVDNKVNFNPETVEMIKFTVIKTVGQIKKI